MTDDRKRTPRGPYKNEPETVIAKYPPSDGMLWENQCARCGSSLTNLDLNLDPVDGWFCLSSAEWCEAHPRPGREDVASGTAEWFQVAEL